GVHRPGPDPGGAQGDPSVGPAGTVVLRDRRDDRVHRPAVRRRVPAELYGRGARPWACRRAVLRLRHDDVPRLRVDHGIPDRARRPVACRGPHVGPAAGLASHGHPRHRDLRRDRDARRRPGQPVRPGRHDVRAVRDHRLVHPALRPMTEAADERSMDPSAAPLAPPPVEQAVVILSGLSGGGKTAAAKLFEDLGYMVIDNLPGELLPDLAGLVSNARDGCARVAIVLDVRAGEPANALGAMRGALEGRGILPRVVFLEARDDVLIRRFSETRHRHPLADERGIASSIAEERRILDPVRAEADGVIDTSDLSLRELRERIFARLGDASDPDRLAIQLISFGFKYGVPLEADLVFDVRFMQNPYYIDELRQLSGLTEAVRDYVLGQPVARQFLEYLHEFLDFALPAYVGEGKTRLTIALGCT